MLILSSNGLSSAALINESKKFISENAQHAAIITTASVGYKEKDWHIPRLTNELTSLGLRADYFDIEFQDPKLLLNYDVIEIIGGNPFFLLKQLNEKSCRAILKEFAESKILIGISAGSIVLQNTIVLVASYSPEMNENVGLTDLTGMGLTDLEILPHYHKFISRFENFEERAKLYEMQNACSVTRIDNGQALFITDSGEYVV